MKDKTKNPVWEEIANCLKPLLRLADGDVGIFLIERKGSAAAIVLGREDIVDKGHLKEAIALFQERLEEMERHAGEGDLDFKSSKSQTFIRESETGKYTPIDPPGNEGN
jgi:hypothetical protein